MRRLVGVAGATVTTAIAIGAVLVVGSAGDGGESAPRAHADETPPAGDTEAEARGVQKAAARAAKAGIDWQVCPPDWDLKNPDYRCGSVTVPVDYAKPDGATIKLSLDRFPSMGTPQERQGALVLNPGGPGASGVTGLLNLTGNRDVWRNVAQAYDLVGFDPRGVGHSAPVSCVDPQEFAKGPKPDPVPDGAADKQRLRDDARAYAQGCQEHSGALLPHMTTANTARDLEVIRAALGEPKLNYLGISYGTYLGAVYGTLFPDHVRRMVVDSVVDPSPAKVWYGMHQAQIPGFERRFADWTTWVAQHDADYHLGDTQAKVRDRWQKLLADAEQHPIGGTVGPSELIDSFQKVVYFDETWAPKAEAWGAYEAGRPEKLVEDAGPHLAETKGNITKENAAAAYTAVNCADSQWPTDWNRWDQDAGRMNAKAPFMAWFSTRQNLPCATWPGTQHAPIEVKGDVKLPPVLLVQNDGDAATPYTGAAELHRRLQGSSLLTVKDAGAHSVTDARNPCVNDRVDAYLLHGTLEAQDMTCDRAPAPVPAPGTPAPVPGAGEAR
ncbi:alpha/beta hydrolase [Streptomyces syringium]|uniref:alpha/beta hydrolase n=1 Tax=Streptomyces syringium TaxID=76729 RepID=UPI00340FE8C1